LQEVAKIIATHIATVAMLPDLTARETGLPKSLQQKQSAVPMLSTSAGEE